jgi:putative acetyltransferase
VYLLRGNRYETKHLPVGVAWSLIFIVHPQSPMLMHIRPERPADAARITEVTQLAFREAAHTCGREHWIVEELRASGALALSLVAVSELGVVGHVAASPVTVSASAGDWFGIGPVSVLPQCQRQGIGSRLMESVLAQLRARGARGCVLVGDPRFYARFGFQGDPSLVVPDVPPEVSLSLRFRQCDDHGTVTFHAAFLAAMAEPSAAPPGRLGGTRAFSEDT